MQVSWPFFSDEKMEKTYPNMNESTVCGFRKRYEAQIKGAHRKKKSPKKVIVNKLTERPCDKIGQLALG